MCENADEALRYLESHTAQLLVTDLQMPGTMSGLELAATVRRRWPSMRVLVASASVDWIPAEHRRAGWIDHILRKPFPIGKLTTAVPFDGQS